MSVETMSGIEFERLVASLIKKMGFEVNSTKATGDGGIDIIAYNDQPMFEGKYIIQCKRWNGSVGSPPVRDLYGVVTHERANKGILITNSTFSNDAIKFAMNKQIELIDGNKLNSLLKSYGLSRLDKTKKESAIDNKLDYLRQQVRDDPKSVRLRVKLAYNLMNDINNYGKEMNDDLLRLISECEIHLLILAKPNPKPKDKLMYFVKYMSYIQLGILKLLQGNIANAIKYLYTFVENMYFCEYIKCKEICVRDQCQTSLILLELYAIMVINIVHLARFLGENKKTNKLISENIPQIIKLINNEIGGFSFETDMIKNYPQHKDMYQKQAKEKAGYKRTFKTLSAKITELNKYKNKLVFTIFSSEDMVNFVKESQESSPMYDLYKFSCIDLDIKRGRLQKIFIMDDKSKDIERKKIKAFL